MNKYEEFALGQFLSAWPENIGYEKIIEILNNYHKCLDSIKWEIGSWEPFENHPWNWLAEQIENTKQSLERGFLIK